VVGSGELYVVLDVEDSAVFGPFLSSEAGDRYIRDVILRGFPSYAANLTLYNASYAK
jgi:hypothetical protein